MQWASPWPRWAWWSWRAWVCSGCCGPGQPGSAALVLLPRDGEDCEALIRAGVARLQWMGWPGFRLVCLNPGEDPNVEAICNIFQRRYPNLELCKCPELVYDKENEKS